MLRLARYLRIRHEYKKNEIEMVVLTKKLKEAVLSKKLKENRNSRRTYGNK